MERLVISRPGRLDQAVVPGHRRDRRQEGNRLEFGDFIPGAAQRACGNVAATDADSVGKEDHIEFAALGGLGVAQVIFVVERCPRRHFGMTPRRRVVANAAHREPELHLPRHLTTPVLVGAAIFPKRRRGATRVLVRSVGGFAPKVVMLSKRPVEYYRGKGEDVDVEIVTYG